jgi:co-chaperonin GroES (HSP10)
MAEFEPVSKSDLEEIRQTFTPYGNRVVIAIDEFKYEGLLEIPETAKRLPTTGVIAAVGPLVDQSTEVVGPKLGDRVLITAYTGTLVMIANKPGFRVCDASEILGMLTQDSTLVATGA